MKRFGKVLRFLKPYLSKVGLSLGFNTLSIFFSLFSLTLLAPVLQILFNQQEPITFKPELHMKVASIAAYFNYYVSQVMTTYGKVNALLFVSIFFLLFSFFKNALLYLGSYFLAPVRTGIVRDIRNSIYSKLLVLPLGYYSEERKGDIISRITSDVNEIEVSTLRSLDLFFREPLMILVYLGSLIYMSPKLTIFVLVMLPISGLLIGRVGRSLRKTSIRGQQTMGTLISVVEETLGGLRVIKAFNSEHRVSDKFRGINEVYSRLMIRNWRRRDLAVPLSEFLGITIMVVVMWYGGNLVLGNEGTLSSSTFIMYIAIFSQLLPPVKNLTTAYYSVIKGTASADRIDYILSTENPIFEKQDAVSLKEFRESIEFRNVSFKYNKDYVLKNVNLTIRKGQTVALVGQSGSGKTTMVDLLPRFYDVMEGEILIDGIPVKDIMLKDLRNLMGNVNQEAILFNDTFYNNIAFGVDVTTPESVTEAAKVANAHDFIMSTPEQYQTNIGDRGSKLSGGQRQRLSIARAVLKNPPIMILDEATSALDSESERLVQDALTRLMENRTSLVIAHRMSTVQHADEICVLHEGEIVERGRHQELLDKGGIYKKLYDLQMFAD
jgi:ATP-binding cassette, subfamily B, bacterial MsbA